MRAAEQAVGEMPAPAGRLLAVCAAVLCLAAAWRGGAAAAASDGATGGSRPKLSRSEGRRWDNVNEVVRSEIKSATRKFLQERERVSLQGLGWGVRSVGLGAKAAAQHWPTGSAPP